MKISIAICTYNGEKYLREQLDSFAAQTRFPDEIIICDDCSKDATREFLTDYASKSTLPIKLHFNETNLGFVKNFERAISLCTGDILVLSDQDDVWETKKLAVIEKIFIESENVGLIYADADTVDENLKSFGKTMWQCMNFDDAVKRKFADGKAFDLLMTKGYVLGSSMAFRARFLDLILPIPSDIYHIHDNWIAMMVAAVAECRLVDECLLKYRQHGNQSSSGVLSRNPVMSAERLKSNNDYDGVIRQLETAEKRLSESNYDAATIKKALTRIKPVKTHLQNRGALPKGTLRRLPIVIKELMAKRYHEHSNGFFSAVKDLIAS